jgi:D-alanine--poly(phosphoribitol) ligase subunit 1
MQITTESPTMNASFAPIVESILTKAAKHAARPALLIEGRSYSYEEFVNHAAQLATKLAQWVEPGVCCAVLAQRSMTRYAGCLGTMLAGCIYLPLSDREPAARHADVLKQSRARCLLVDAHCAGMLKDIVQDLVQPLIIVAPEIPHSDLLAMGLPQTVALLGAESFCGEPGLRGRRNQDDAAYLIFTSGSTGTPKGVLVSHAAVDHYVRAIRDCLPTHAEDRFSQLFDPGFDLSVHDMLVCWASGACLVPVPKANLLRVGEAVRDQRITVWFSVPSSISIIERLGQLRPELLGSLRLSLFCGEALMSEDARRWRRGAPNSDVYNLYGPTEATIAVSLCKSTEATEGGATVPIGQPFGETRFLLLDPASDQVVGGEEGELGIAGPQLAHGYWNAAELTAKKFPQILDESGKSCRVYRTGDRVRRLADGDYVYLGRLDNEIKIDGGYRLNLLEAEGLVREAASCRTAIVVHRIDARTGMGKLVAFVDHSAASDASIREQLRVKAPSYMWPQEIRRIEDFPQLSNGKINRKALAQLADSPAPALVAVPA